eukprot:CAMPEP_0113454296 /NCGR_PEP_ID=MMETSP0014_2-20120614/7790_1 /TAXON_ID=2857 /ORGANISM="Nitzschia sp." /LENGTH=1145 /DNA_ID=CAMNT_0000345697 /DNA_START=149 /DNA_END=3586 /DNA_ORIENTATION=- /assembly_acc=CAM_ASM_000159
MPPGGRRPGRPLGASVAGIINSDAKDDDEARRRVIRLFGTVLGVVFLVDILCSFGVVVLSCQHYHHDHDHNHDAANHAPTAPTNTTTTTTPLELGDGVGGATDGDEIDDDFFRSALSESFLFGPFFDSSSSSSSSSSGVNMDGLDFDTFAADNTTTNATTTSTDAGGAVSRCVRTSIVRGFVTFRPIANNNDPSSTTETLGDLFAMSVMRCFAFLGLLMLGIKYGGGGNNNDGGGGGGEGEEDDDGGGSDGIDNNSDITPAATAATAAAARRQNSNSNSNSSNNDLTEPLLLTRPSSTTATTASTCRPCASSSSDGLLDDDDDDDAEDDDDISQASWLRRVCCWVTMLSPSQLQTFIVVKLFVLCTFYQVYAGLKVATLVHPATESIIPLLCLTVLWINVESYIFRTLLGELTREDGLYLPPEVHRHPMYLVKSRNISVHWCDLCHRPIGGKKSDQGGSSSSSSSSNRNDDDHNKSCYRCALCDFDVCMKCAKRKDAATVGENILRTDSGARVEQSMTTSGYVRRSVQVAKSELPLILISFVLLGATSISRLLLPDFQGRIIDKVIPNPETGEYDRHGFQRFIKIYVLVMVAQATLLTLYSAILTLVSRRLKFTLRNALLEKILIQDVAYFDGTESGRLISRLTNDLDLMMAPIQSSLSSLLSNVLILFGGLIMCFAKSYRLSMISFITIGPISALWEQYATWSKGLAREMLSYWGEGNSIASQVLSHIRTVKAFGCEQKVLQKYSDINEHALHCGVKDAWGNALTTALTGLLDLGSGVLILWFGGLLVFRGELSVGELVTFQLFWNMMNNAFQNLQSLITSFTRSAAGAEKVFSMWDSHPDIDPNRGQDVNWNVEGHIQLKNVKFFYQMRPDNIVLKDFSLDIPAGKTLALVGRSGGGKSTIINLLLRFYDPREGKLVLDGRDYNSIRVDQLRRLFGVVTQETELFALTVEENIAYGLDKDEYTMDDVIDAAKKSYAHDFISEMKDGYQTRIGERGNRLSGGQRQRLAIARVFLRKPKLILLDEATSALDENSQEAVQKALANLIEESQATVVLVAHRLSTVVNADSICVIDKGSVLEQGNHDELVAHGGIYASMVEKQLKKKEDVLDQDGKKNQQGGGAEKNKNKTSASADDIDALLDEASNI